MKLIKASRSNASLAAKFRFAWITTLAAVSFLAATSQAAQLEVQKYFPTSQGLVQQNGKLAFTRTSQLENLIISCFEISVEYRGIGFDQTDYIIPLCNSLAEDYMELKSKGAEAKEKLFVDLHRLQAAVFENPKLNPEARDKFKKLSIGTVIESRAANEVQDICFKVSFFSLRVALLAPGSDLQKALLNLDVRAKSISAQANSQSAFTVAIHQELELLLIQLQVVDEALGQLQFQLQEKESNLVRSLRLLARELAQKLE